MRRLLFCIGCLLLSGYVHADVTLTSGKQRTHVIELYTSEGCNSCPPAESFLNQYADHPGLWTSIIPLAFHVDYWNYLGWRDPYSSEQYSKRQRQYAVTLRQNTVYTPEFFVDGNEWRAGFYNKQPRLQDEDTGVLNVVLGKNQLEAGFAPLHSDNQPWVLHVAVVGSGLESNITRGENAGRKAQHNFVVLNYQRYDSQHPMWKVVKPALTDMAKQAKSLTLVVWVSRANDPAPVQAVAYRYPQ